MGTALVKHLLVDAKGCTGPLNDAEALLALSKTAAGAVGATEMGDARACYVPHGVTTVLFLAESHILVSTWPEFGTALVDILICDPEMSPMDVWDQMARLLCPEAVEMHHVSRG
jgi:S-adenosylmethionine decarboxylase